MSGPAPLPGWLGRLLGVGSPPAQVPRPPAPPAGPVRAAGERPAGRAGAVRRPVEGPGEQERPPAPPDPPPTAATRSTRPGTVAEAVRLRLGSPRDARVAVATAEVLAPPRALRPYRGPGG